MNVLMNRKSNCTDECFDEPRTECSCTDECFDMNQGLSVATDEYFDEPKDRVSECEMNIQF